MHINFLLFRVCVSMEVAESPFHNINYAHLLGMYNISVPYESIGFLLYF